MQIYDVGLIGTCGDKLYDVYQWNDWKYILWLFFY